VLLAQGPGIRRDDLVFGATLLDVAPTALAMLGLAPPAELEGKVLAEVFTEAPVLHPADSPPAPSGDAAANDAPGADLDRRWGAARILELVALGYLAQPPSDPATAAGAARIQGLLNLARVQMGRRDWAAALESLAALLALAPDHLEGRFAVAQCRLQMGDTGRCREVLDDIAESGAGGPSLAFLYGQLCIKEGDRAAAADHLRRAEEGGIPGRLLLERIGRAHLSAQNWSDAERSLRNALAIDPDFAMAHNGLGHALAAQGRHHEAIEHLRLAIGILRMQPDAHYRLGLSLAALGRPLEAAQALRNALSMEPNLPGAQAAMGRVQRQLAQAAIADANDEGQRST
jgi:tetratricopeptide (TPR) repeat protein